MVRNMGKEKNPGGEQGSRVIIYNESIERNEQWKDKRMRPYK